MHQNRLDCILDIIWYCHCMHL